MRLSEMQVQFPWTVHYSQDYRLNPLVHKDFGHALIHVTKASGKLAELVDNIDHDRTTTDDLDLAEKYSKYLADLVVCALRMANTFPGKHIDLERAVIDRLETKNNVKLHTQD
jgi:hypothetical protein